MTEIYGPQFVQTMIERGILAAGTDANTLMAAAHRNRAGKRYATIPGVAEGVLDCRTGYVVVTPVDSPTEEDARDWAAELNG